MIHTASDWAIAFIILNVATIVLDMNTVANTIMWINVVYIAALALALAGIIAFDVMVSGAFHFKGILGQIILTITAVLLGWVAVAVGFGIMLVFHVILWERDTKAIHRWLNV